MLGASASNEAQAGASFAGALVVTLLAGAQPEPLRWGHCHVAPYHSAPLSHCVLPSRLSG